MGDDRIQELLDTMDEVIPLPERPIDQPFSLSIDGKFNIEGRGLVITGTVDTGQVKKGDEIEIVGFGQKKKSVVTGVETFNKTLDHGEAGDNIGLLVRGLNKKEVQRG